MPLCPRCVALIRQAGRDGLKLKAMGEKWFGSHRVGRFKAKGFEERDLHNS